MRQSFLGKDVQPALEGQALDFVGRLYEIDAEIKKKELVAEHSRYDAVTAIATQQEFDRLLL